MVWDSKPSSKIRDLTVSTNIGVLGAAGRMGRMLCQIVLAHDAARLAGGVDHPQSPLLGQDLGVLAGRTEPIGLLLDADRRGLFERSDVVVDFTLPTASDENLSLAAETNTPLVLGTTGLSPTQEDFLNEMALRVPVLYSANYSLGVNLLIELTKQAAASLQGFDIEVLEMHHNQKIDAPSGTALALGQAAAEGRNWDFDQVACLSREGQTGQRPDQEIGFATLRGGDVAGDHSVIFAGKRETITLQHFAADRVIFAQGAIAGALWLAAQKSPGRYAMKDVLGL